jgi:nucleotide-binding universal stress UspA family protein
MFKDLMVPMTASAGDMDALNTALDLAANQGAHLSVLELVNLPMPLASPWGLMPDVTAAEAYGPLREQGERNVTKLKKRLEKEAVSTEVRLVESLFVEPARMAAHCAHYADLTIVAGPLGDTAEATVAQMFFGSLLLESGRPVLVVPPRCKTPMPPRRIVAAWRPTTECARALHDALPLLVSAEAVDLLVVDPIGGERGHGEQPGVDIASHLARHGVKVNVVVRESKRSPVSEILLEHAREIRAELLVAGGYGHSRLREWAMGGVTRDLLIGATIPVFFSH